MTLTAEEKAKINFGYCRDCRHWVDGSCALVEYDFENEGAHPDSLARAYDGEQYHAGLSTEPNFGCVQFAEKL